MTERLAHTRRRIESVRQLEAVVAAMRGISASRTQQAHALMNGLHAYAAVVAGAIGQALALLPPGQQLARTRHRGVAVILFCGEQGFAGAFSDRMLEALMPDSAAQDVFLIGTRGAALAAERGIPVTWRTAMVPHASMVPILAGRVATALYDWLLHRQGPRVEMIVPTWSADGGVVAERRLLMPFDFHRFKIETTQQPPLVTLPPATLLERLAEEYIFAELCDAVFRRGKRTPFEG